MRFGLAVVALTLTLTLAAGIAFAAPTDSNQAYPPLKSQHGQPPNGPPPGVGQYQLLAWSELGMHCMDGKDYSIFAVLPPFNVIHAQLIKQGEPPVQVTSGITITYEAFRDPSGSMNTISSTKTNFWSYVQTLFLTSPPPDTGITGNSVQNLTPHPLSYDAKNGYWTADGIPTVPYDDYGNHAPYSMAKIVARDGLGNVLATASIVLSVSDEMTCSKCHASNSDPYAKPRMGWENDPDPAKDVKLNILRKHDDRVRVIYWLVLLKRFGYTYLPSLHDTAKSGTTVLCATCHGSAALGTLGFPGIRTLTSAMHALHGPQINLDDGIILDNETDPAKSCYLCHPGNQTKCQRGAMNKTACQDCHGNPSLIGQQSRRGWLDLPACQMCHTNSQRYTTTFDSPGHWRVSTDPTFATNKDKPVLGAQLYRYSSGHGQLYCSGCHGSPHAEFPTLQTNDNLYSQQMQGHVGKIAECSVCHTNLPVDLNNGPHGIHSVGQLWVDSHHDHLQGGTQQCAYCHGSDYRGSALSKTSMARSFSTDDGGQKNYNSGDMVSCYDCHNGPGGG